MLAATLLNFAALLRPVRPPNVRTTAPRAVLADSLQQYLTTPAEELGTKSKETHDIDWLKQWYPLAHTRALRKSEPNAMKLLETPLVDRLVDTIWDAIQQLLDDDRIGAASPGDMLGSGGGAAAFGASNMPRQTRRADQSTARSPLCL